MPSPSIRRVGFASFLLVVLLAAAGPAAAQLATLSGFVTNRANGSALRGANVLLHTLADSVVAGTTADADGLFLFPMVEPGRYVLRVSFIGFRTHRDTLRLEPEEDRTVNVALRPGRVGLAEVEVASDREGGVSLTAGRQTIRPEDLERVPTPDVSGDLASYLTTLPSVVTSGDRGGQLFIRGGEPSQNLILLDGMTLYQPFHVLGFYSAFPSDIVREADVYAGGFGSRFGERIASVVDVHSRQGNKQSVAGAAGLSPFLGSLRLEGPLANDRVSLLASARQSLLQAASWYTGEELPFTFGDAFAKIHADLNPRSRLSASTLGTYDQGRLRSGTEGTLADEVRWKNQAGGVRWLTLPRFLAVPTSLDLRLAFSRHHTALGPQRDPVRASSVSDLHLTFDMTFFDEHVNTHMGMVVRYLWLSSRLGGRYQNIRVEDAEIAPFALYLEPDFELGRFRVQPGIRAQIHHVRASPFFEPRLRLVWRRGIHEVSAAAGRYHQELLGLADRRDAASIFTAWTNIPRRDNRSLGVPGLDTKPRFQDVRKGREMRSVHGLLGYRLHPTAWLSLNVEGFYRRYENLFIAEWSPFASFTTRMQPADGRSAGLDARLEVDHDRFYGYIGYGLSFTRYRAKQPSLATWYDTETLIFRPPHDRRHQVNSLISTELYAFDLSIRWHFGSGLPFNRVLAFDGFTLIDGLVNVSREPGPRRVVYERPFRGRLPPYHRLDISLARTFEPSQNVALTIQASVINAYDRRNLFYLDTFTLQRTDQLPLVPSLGIHVSFE